MLSGLQKVRRAGKVGLGVKPTRAGRKLMRGRSRKLALTIELSFTRSDGTSRKATRRVVLRPR